jgi:hypothetical protein
VSPATTTPIRSEAATPTYDDAPVTHNPPRGASEHSVPEGPGKTVSHLIRERTDQTSLHSVSTAELQAAEERSLKGSSLGEALAVLQRLLDATSPDAAVWQDAARQLKALLQAEGNRSRRHAALILLLSKALSYTSPDQLEDTSAAAEVLDRGRQLLSGSFVSESNEREVMDGLLAAGWRITRPYGGWWQTGA